MQRPSQGLHGPRDRPTQPSCSRGDIQALANVTHSMSDKNGLIPQSNIMTRLLDQPGVLGEARLAVEVLEEPPIDEPEEYFVAARDCKCDPAVVADQLRHELVDIKSQLQAVLDENDRLKIRSTADKFKNEMMAQIEELKTMCEKLKLDRQKETTGLALEMAMLSAPLADQKVQIAKLKLDLATKSRQMAELQGRVESLTLQNVALKSGQQVHTEQLSSAAEQTQKSSSGTQVNFTPTNNNQPTKEESPENQ